jgi:hypothetical protein
MVAKNQPSAMPDSYFEIGETVPADAYPFSQAFGAGDCVGG